MAVRESINPALNKGIFRVTTGSSVIDNTPRNVHHLAKLDRRVVQQPTTRSAEMGENQRSRPYGLVTRVHCPADPELSGRSGRHEKARVIKDAGLCYSRDQDPIPAPLLYQGNGAPPESEMNSRLLPVTENPTTPETSPGVQLVHADVAKATQPGLFDNLPDSAFTVDHQLLINARPADRMLLCLAMDVSASAVKVAVALAYHGWTSWPSRETLCRLTNLKSPHVTRATNELEKAGFVARRRRYHTGGNVGIQYTFKGLALAEATIHQDHPTLQTAITKLVTAPVNALEQRPTAITDLVTAEPQVPLRDYQIGNGAITNLVPEPEVIEPEGVTLIDEINQSNSGSSGSNHAREKNDRPPPWYRELATALDLAQLPDLRAIEEQALLAGWSDAVLQSAAQIYLRNYRNQRVTDPFALFRKLAIQEASKVAAPAKPSPPSYSDDRRRRR